MNRKIWLFKFAAILTLIITLSANVPAERYIFQDGWSLDMNESVIGDTVPARIDLSERNGTLCLLLFKIENTNTTYILASWSNNTNLQTVLATSALTNSIFGSICGYLGGSYFETETITKSDKIPIFGEKQLMVIRASNSDTNETKGYYVPLSFEEGNHHCILTLGATNITSEQWDALLTSVCLNRPSR